MATKSKKSLTEIESEIVRLTAEAERIRKVERAEVIDRIKVAIAHYGITEAELELKRKPGRAKGAKAVKSAKPARAAAKTTREAKYGDGTGNTWSGWGKRPNWLRAALAEGKPLEGFRLK